MPKGTSQAKVMSISKKSNLKLYLEIIELMKVSVSYVVS